MVLVNLMTYRILHFFVYLKTYPIWAYFNSIIILILSFLETQTQEKSVPQKMNPNKLAQFASAQNDQAENISSNNAIREELELLKQLQKQKQDEVEESGTDNTTANDIYENYEDVQPPAQFTQHTVSIFGFNKLFIWQDLIRIIGTI